MTHFRFIKLLRPGISLLVLVLCAILPQVESQAVQFPVNPHRSDPYKGFKFRVKWDTRYVAGISKISPLKRTTEAIFHRAGNEPSIARKSPGTTTFAPIILERGRTHDPEFEAWARLVWDLEGNPEVTLSNFRKDIIIDLFNEAQQLVMSFKLYRCWPSEYVVLSELNANSGSSPAIESITLQCEGWERDPEVVEPVEP